MRVTKKNSNSYVNVTMPLLRAGGVVVSTGAVSTLFGRAYTDSWTKALGVGLCGMGFATCFVFPHMMQKINLNRAEKKAVNCETVNNGLKKVKYIA